MRRAFLMGNALVCGIVEKIGASLNEFINGNPAVLPYEKKATPQPLQEIDFNAVLQEYKDGVVSDNKQQAPDIDPTKNVLISLVKNDTIQLFLDGSANIYYTGHKFPSTVALNKLYYFMPYRKGKGVKDLYFIKIARVGSKHELHPDADEKDLRLVFEIEFVKTLFPDYKMFPLEIWHTFTDTQLEKIL